MKIYFKKIKTYFKKKKAPHKEEFIKLIYEGGRCNKKKKKYYIKSQDGEFIYKIFDKSCGDFGERYSKYLEKDGNTVYCYEVDQIDNFENMEYNPQFLHTIQMLYDYGLLQWWEVCEIEGIE